MTSLGIEKPTKTCKIHSITASQIESYGALNMYERKCFNSSRKVCQIPSLTIFLRMNETNRRLKIKEILNCITKIQTGSLSPEWSELGRWSVNGFNTTPFRSHWRRTDPKSKATSPLTHRKSSFNYRESRVLFPIITHSQKKPAVLEAKARFNGSLHFPRTDLSTRTIKKSTKQ